MSKKTLLQIVQNILSAMDGDEVNSISDTIEAMQVAEEVRNAYEDLTGTLALPSRKALVHLDSLSNVNMPNYLAVPGTVKEVLWIRYNGVEVKYMSPEDFVKYIFDSKLATNMSITDPEGTHYSITNTRDPKYFTSFDQTNVAFDSFNAAKEATLQSTNSMAFCEMLNTFQMVDTFVCDLPDDFFPTFIAEAKNACFVNMKQVANAVESARARRGIVRMQNEFYRTSRGNPADRLPDYSRRK